MTLEKILKGLKKGECQKYYTTDDCHCVIEVWRNDDGFYRVALGSTGGYTVCCKKAEEVLEVIKEKYHVHWTEFDYEVYKDCWELKEENVRLRKALEIACKYLTRRCTENCPLYDKSNAPCNDKSEVIPTVNKFEDTVEYILKKDVASLYSCVDDVSEYLLIMADRKELENES